jgi:hypothetical protein
MMNNGKLTIKPGVVHPDWFVNELEDGRQVCLLSQKPDA